MPDTSIKSWECDWCGKRFTAQDYGFEARFSVDIRGFSSYNRDYDRLDTYVCIHCIDKVNYIANAE